VTTILIVRAAMAAAMAAAPAPSEGGVISPSADTTPIACDSCEAWNQPQVPFRVFGNTWYVGVKGLSSVLIQTPGGSILIDGGLPQSAALIADNLRALGKRLTEIKWILISHAHYDHVGGVAALARMSGARVAASPRAAEVLRRGNVEDDDPQAAFGDHMRFPPVANVVELRDGATIRLGGTTVTIHHTPGHTPGGASWTWKSCEGRRCLPVVYADSLNPVSAPGFRFSAVPARLRQFESSISTIRGLPCEVLISAHPSFSSLFEKQAARERQRPSPDQHATADETGDPMIDPEACRRYADEASSKLDQRVREETKEEAKGDARPK
jgi:metallo-beta-lactamase class B